MPPERVRAFAPGRVNLVGEHTDYNEGLCLPFAIARGVTVTAAPHAGGWVEAHAADLSEHDAFELGADLRPPAAAGGHGGWRAVLRGAVAELRDEGMELRACRLEIEGDLPMGAGLGSSAALSVSICLALCAVAGAEPPGRLALARLCSRVENRWCGADTGLLDQLACLHGRAGCALLIDMRGPSVEPLGLDLRGHVLGTLPSGAPRRLAASGYNTRRGECRRAARALGAVSLRDVSEERLHELPEPLRRRARHVLGENRRVAEAAIALARGEPAALGPILDASHASLRDDFEVSVPEVERALGECRAAGAIGARMVGGGFGGSVLALFPPGARPPDAAVAAHAGPGAHIL
jgi:galactokinase